MTEYKLLIIYIISIIHKNMIKYFMNNFNLNSIL